jgi:NADH:ubiquinone oxidoreductase subunit 2 (subunit N)
MRPKHFYLAVAVLGLVLPYWHFVPWVLANGLNMRLFANQLFVNPISRFFGMDLLVSAVALVLFMRFERRRSNIQETWIPLLALVTVGVSLALPLFLYLRERALERQS